MRLGVRAQEVDERVEAVALWRSTRLGPRFGGLRQAAGLACVEQHKRAEVHRTGRAVQKKH